MSCRSLTSSLTTPLGSSLGTLSPRSTNLVTAAPRPLFTPRSNPVTATSRPRFTPRSRPQRHFGHVPRLRPARVTCQHLLLCGVLLAHRAPRMGPALVQRIPQDLERVAVRLPDGNGLGQGPCSASPTWFPQRRPRHAPLWRRRHPVTALSGPRARPDPDTSRHDARAIRSPYALAEQANRPKCPGEGPYGRCRCKVRRPTTTSHSRHNCSRDMV